MGSLLKMLPRTPFFTGAFQLPLRMSPVLRSTKECTEQLEPPSFLTMRMYRGPLSIVTITRGRFVYCFMYSSTAFWTAVTKASSATLNFTMNSLCWSMAWSRFIGVSLGISYRTSQVVKYPRLHECQVFVPPEQLGSQLGASLDDIQPQLPGKIKVDFAPLHHIREALGGHQRLHFLPLRLSHIELESIPIVVAGIESIVLPVVFQLTNAMTSRIRSLKLSFIRHRTIELGFNGGDVAAILGDIDDFVGVHAHILMAFFSCQGA
jgi:hypothetical protein